MYLGTSDAFTLAVTGASCEGWARHLNYFPVTVRYVVGCISRPRRPCCSLPSSDFMVDVFAWILLLFCNAFCGWFCTQWPPQILLFSWREVCCKYLPVWKSLVFFGFTKFGVLELFLIFMAGPHRGSAQTWCACFVLFSFFWFDTVQYCDLSFIIS